MAKNHGKIKGGEGEILETINVSVDGETALMGRENGESFEIPTSEIEWVDPPEPEEKGQEPDGPYDNIPF